MLIDGMSVEEDHNLYISLHNKKNRYFFCHKTQCWIELNLNDGLLQAGDSLKVGEL